ncbi:hypothetical protein H4R99_000793 [Coemansia sp. RSA 1722]|nr:hypothetical protein H4R99_000793 [Coemansia sp. RSA 1722]
MTGIGKKYTNSNTTSCTQIGHGVLHGCEDIVVDPHTGLAYLACGNLKPRQHWLHPDDDYDYSFESQLDHIYVMDESNEFYDIKLVEKTSDGMLQPFSQDLRLHGFDIHWDPEDSADMTFMLVNHQLDHGAVSIFSYRRGSDHMVHVETVRTELLRSPNNIVAMSKRSFYATNDMKYYRGIMREVAANLRLPTGHVVYRDESGSFDIAANFVGYPNGIARDNDWIYVASCTDPGIQVYKHTASDGLTYHGRTRYWDSIPDNFFVDPQTGQIYSTSFLKVSETHKYFKNPSLNTTTTAGTKLLRLTPRDGDPSKGFDIESLLIDSGKIMPTATIAAVQRRNAIQRLLVGISKDAAGCFYKASLGVRLYSDKNAELLKGTPKFTRVQPKNAGFRRDGKNTTNADKGKTEWRTSGREELNSKKVGHLLFIGGAVATGIGLMGVAAYYIGTYLYLRSKWPVADEIEGGTVRNLLYLATYYQHLEPNHKRALSALNKALEIINKSGKVSENSVAVLEIKVRIAECMYVEGDKKGADRVLRQIMSDISKNAKCAETASAAEILLFRAAAVLGGICTDESRFEDAILEYSLGLQAVKRLKQQAVSRFDSESLVEYTEIDNINLKEATLTLHLAESFFAQKDMSTAQTLFQGVLAAAKQHRAHLDVAPRIVTDYRTFKDEWACLDAQAMLFLAKIQNHLGNAEAAAPWIVSARSLATERKYVDVPRCIDCMSEIFAELGRMAESRGDTKKALRRYSEAYENARLNFRENQSRYIVDLQRLEQKKK